MPDQIRLKGVSLVTAVGRPLFEALDLTMGDERVALVGRNGVGKSTLLELLAGERQANAGSVYTRSKPFFLPQLDGCEEAALSLGELRRRGLEQARTSGAEILLLDEPSEHLDEAALRWLREWLLGFHGCLLLCSHDRRLLADFEHFFVVSEAGCHYFHGSLEKLEQQLQHEHDLNERRYVRNLNRLAAQEERTLHVARRKARKKRYGRCSELDRCNPRILLNQKRDRAQVSHGRLAKLREARLAELQSWTKSTRRALDVQLPLELSAPALAPIDPTRAVIALQGVSERVRDRTLFAGIDVRLGRERVALTGPNGAGKTTLLQILAGRRRPTVGSARCDLSALASIEQGGRNWLLDESLRECLLQRGLDAEACAQTLLAHRFPLALSERPLRSLSPGERARAALICAFSSSPAPQVLLLDEPTFSLDLVGLRALTAALKAWPGGLVIASHDSAFLAEVGVDRTIQLGAHRPYG
ncbi:MAG: ATP-binding cassette domain-containing protein [Myxococcota bacterium]